MFDTYPLLRSSPSLSPSALFFVDNDMHHVARRGSPSPSTGSGSDADADGVPDDDDGMELEYSTSASSLPFNASLRSTPSSSFVTSCGDVAVVSSPSTRDQEQEQGAASVSAILSSLPKILRQLKTMVALRTVIEDRTRTLCQYEIPGGGECRDGRCVDMHLKEMIPSGTCPIHLASCSVHPFASTVSVCANAGVFYCPPFSCVCALSSPLLSPPCPCARRFFLAQTPTPHAICVPPCAACTTARRRYWTPCKSDRRGRRTEARRASRRRKGWRGRWRSTSASLTR